MRFLLIPGNNSLSHAAKALAILEILIHRGHDARIAVSRRRALFLKKLGFGHYILPDIQESDEAGFPTVNWFNRPQRTLSCIKAEVNLLREFKPHRVLGIFRFTLKGSAKIAGIPYDSLICGCMLPGSQEVLGFAPEEPGIENQRYNLEVFYQFAGIKMGTALKELGLEGIADMREMLKGDRTFLWDFPEFMPLSTTPDVIHIGPIYWNKWPYDGVDPSSIFNNHRPLAVVAFGTCMSSVSTTDRILRLLIEAGYNVLLAAGGNKELLNIMPAEPRVFCCNFAPLHELLPRADLIISHGGQMSIFEALKSKTPILVMPFQPEQAHNGVCLERIGCGGRLVPPQPFRGSSEVYFQAFEAMRDPEVHSIIAALINNAETAVRLDEVSSIMQTYRGVETLADFFVEG